MYFTYKKRDIVHIVGLILDRIKYKPAYRYFPLFLEARNINE
jgi:hypothetical protein